MVLKDRDLWGIIATGDIFNCGGKLSLMSPYRTTFEYPFNTLVAVSSCKAFNANFELAEGCVPRRMAASICSCVQLFPQSTGQPCSA